MFKTRSNYAIAASHLERTSIFASNFTRMEPVEHRSNANSNVEYFSVAITKNEKSTRILYEWKETFSGPTQFLTRVAPVMPLMKMHIISPIY